jgi:hypothetical protein
MKLSRVDIQNFRSIAELRLPFDFPCQALIGINESGKSNILRALHLLEPTVATVPSDLRIERHDEQQVKAGHVRFVFDLNDGQLDEVTREASQQFVSETLNEPLIASAKEQFSLESYCKLSVAVSPLQALYTVSVPSGSRVATIWSRPADQVLPFWYRNKGAAPVSLALSTGTIIVPPKGIIYAGSELATDHFEKFEYKDLTPCS